MYQTKPQLSFESLKKYFPEEKPIIKATIKNYYNLSHRKKIEMKRLSKQIETIIQPYAEQIDSIATKAYLDFLLYGEAIIDTTELDFSQENF